MGAAESTTRQEVEPDHIDFDSLNFYEILGISEDATAEEIKCAWRQKVLQHHPDKNLDDPSGADKRFKQIQEAFQTLTDDVKRRDYDYTRKTSWSTKSTPAPTPTPSNEDDPSVVPGAFTPTKDETPSESWYQWFFKRGGQHADAKSKFVYETYSSCQSPGPGISSRDIAEFINSIGSFSWRADDSQDAFKMFGDLFACLGHDEWLHSGVDCPSFGCRYSLWTHSGWDEQELEDMNVHGPEIRQFYDFWTKFETTKSFDWIKRYYTSGHLNARTQRYVRKENKLVQARFRQEYNELIQRLALALRESDPRYQLHLVLQAQRTSNQAPSQQTKNQKKKDKKRKNKNR